MDAPTRRDSIGEPTEPDIQLVNQAAGFIARRYDRIEAEDVAQEVWVWWLGKGKDVIARYREEVDIAMNAGDSSLALAIQARMVKAVQNAAVNYCERERKANLGYDWRDDYNYSRPEVARILPLALDPSTIPGLSGGGLHDGPSAKSDPAYGGGMLASIVDVRAAFAKLSGDDQEFMRLCVALDSKWDTIGVHLGIQPNSAYAKYYRILDRMVTRHLGRVKDDAAA
jgi:hypothetical protein